METNFKNTDFFIEEIDESVKDLTVHDSSVTHSPANTDFFIENIDNNVIEIASDRGITPSIVSVVPANTDFFIVNIDDNIKKIASDLSITPSSVSKTPANTDFFIENIYFNLILICEELNITPSEITVTPTNTDFFIEAIAENVEKIMEAQTEIHVSGTFIHAVLSADSEISDYELDGNAIQTTYSGKNLLDALGASYITEVGATPTKSGNSITFTKTQDGQYRYAILRLTTAQTNALLNSTLTMSFNKTTSINGVQSGVRVYWMAENSVQVGTAIDSTNGLSNTSGSKSFTFNIPATPPDNTKPCIGFFFYPDMTNAEYSSSSTMTMSSIQLEKGSTATAYEPYVGGTASPNPDYPQAINTVTGEQTVSVCGKNLCTGLNSGYYDISSKTLIDTTSIRFKGFKVVVGSGTYTLSCNTKINVVRAFTDYDSSSNVVFSGIQTNVNSFTMNVTQATTLYLSFRRNDNTDWLATDLIQLELGNQSSSYEPYQGQSYTIDLDSIELAKIGTYQDRIYKDSGKWYIEKQVGKITYDGSEAGWFITGNVFRNPTAVPGGGSITATAGGMSNYYTYWTNIGSISTNLPDGQFGFTSADWLINIRNSSCADVTAFKTWLGTHPTTVYYALETPTNTEITDETLLSQLNAIYDAELKEGVVNISITATSPNLPASLKATIIAKE